MMTKERIAELRLATLSFKGIEAFRTECLDEIESLKSRVAELEKDKAKRPRIVCLCGSTRFWKQFQEQNLRLTTEGVIVLSIGMATASDTEHLANGTITQAQKEAFDELHKRKIDLADEVLVLNVGGYIGSSTRSEIEYATAKGIPVSYLEAIDAAIKGPMTNPPKAPYAAIAYARGEKDSK